MIGRVISTKTAKTATVVVERRARHPLYRKTFIRSKRYLVDDTLGVKDGDIVEIEKCQPVSKRKHFKIVKVLGKNLVEIAEAQQKKAAEEIIAQVMPEEKEMEESSDVSHQTERPVNKKRMRKKEKSES
ncbi:30S ribosomal protein S17 [Candidatus Daviesbacteria bacterium RIFCSPLOWO2_01_FULL_39_12]|uniref:30S ribosomal protein S17 n=1 Tax=Candidatus Daviesbacteria bacterium RIFCSPLOWO2_01_FULL_39_12 TaxID=1797785 RepID=A0A1F5KL95_9BACT|nr:MAG: 30S ribosomal protein S17 [Candidatus Daviesbacteria bacterium RIFCSPHIGHO2_02_FULL_39_8]OGE41698.1 MAG: 30S ribosomal protein S17 [Candidatus Daviesbacteria bacterium RIFCSPLOWO2_01_FULL_39_12]